MKSIMHRVLPTSVVVAAALLGVAALVPDPARSAASAGEQAFAACEACHSTDGNSDAAPTLKGIVGRKSASIPGFPYSSAMKRANLTWTTQELDRYIADPQAV